MCWSHFNFQSNVIVTCVMRIDGIYHWKQIKPTYYTASRRIHKCKEQLRIHGSLLTYLVTLVYCVQVHKDSFCNLLHFVVFNHPVSWKLKKNKNKPNISMNMHFNIYCIFCGPSKSSCWSQLLNLSRQQ